jgi:ribose 5-phosphate isomerase B
MKIAIGSDHGGIHLKGEILQYLVDLGIEHTDFGTYSDQSCDYPDFVIPVTESVVRGEFDRGILICGTGIGMSIAANKVHGIRAALCHDCFSAKATREHNDSNVLCMGERVIGRGLALEIVKIWLETAFTGGRHQQRINKISEIERGNES